MSHVAAAMSISSKNRMVNADGNSNFFFGLVSAGRGSASSVILIAPRKIAGRKPVASGRQPNADRVSLPPQSG